MKSIKSEEFFKLTASNSGIADLQTVKDIFYGMIKTISRELKDKHIVKLPDWGEFTLKVHKARRMVDVNDKVTRTLPAKLQVKFTPDYKVKKYFAGLGEDSTMI